MQGKKSKKGGSKQQREARQENMKARVEVRCEKERGPKTRKGKADDKGGWGWESRLEVGLRQDKTGGWSRHEREG